MSDSKSLILVTSQKTESMAPCGESLASHRLPCAACRNQSLSQQVLRLSGLKFFPVEFMAQNELLIALGDLGESTAHAEAFVTNWLRENSECPTPYHVYVSKPRRPDNADGTNPYGEYRPAWLKDERPC